MGELLRIGGGFVVELARIGGGCVVEPARGGSDPEVIDALPIGGGFVVEPARIGSDPEVIAALPIGGGFVVVPARIGSDPEVIAALPIGGGFVVEPARIGGGFVVEPARIGGGFVVEPARIGGGFVVEPARPGGANPEVDVVGLGAAAKPAAVVVVEVSGCTPESVGTIVDERSCAPAASTFRPARAIGPPRAVGTSSTAARVSSMTGAAPTTVAPLWNALASTSGTAGLAIGGGFEVDARRGDGSGARGGNCTPVGGALRSLRRGGSGGKRRPHAEQTVCSSAFSALQKGQNRIATSGSCTRSVRRRSSAVRPW